MFEKLRGLKRFYFRHHIGIGAVVVINAKDEGQALRKFARDYGNPFRICDQCGERAWDLYPTADGWVPSDILREYGG